MNSGSTTPAAAKRKFRAPQTMIFFSLSLSPTLLLLKLEPANAIHCWSVVAQ